jgi:uncharacterized membrane protein
MPQIVIERRMSDINPDEIWKIARKLTDFPDFMDQVVSIDLLSSNDERDITSWKVMLDGNELHWIEWTSFNDDFRRTRFYQLEGDLAEWKGTFEIVDLPDGSVLGRYQIEFDLGIPALAAELNPLCEHAIRSNCDQMLEQMEMRSRCLSTTR